MINTPGSLVLLCEHKDLCVPNKRKSEVWLQSGPVYLRDREADIKAKGAGPTGFASVLIY